MSLFSWLFPAESRPTPPESSGLSRMDATRPAQAPADKDAAPNNAQPANRKGERMARRELLYTVVRDAMTRAGVLSSELQVQGAVAGRARPPVPGDGGPCARHGGETARLAEIEALIAQGAKARYDILVSAVYWRMNDHVAVGDPNRGRSSDRATRRPCRWTRRPPEPTRAGRAGVCAGAAGAAPAPPRLALRPDPGRRGGGVQAALAAGVANPAAAAAAAVGVPMAPAPAPSTARPGMGRKAIRC